MPNIIVVHYDEDLAAIEAFKNTALSHWNDHINFAKDAIVSAFADGADIPAIVDRLSKNQDDISGLLTTHYGEEAAATLNGYLKTHVSLLTDLIAAAKAGTSLIELDLQWKQNAKDLATFLSTLDTCNWTADAFNALLDEHLAATHEEIAARVVRDPVAWIAAYDRNHAAINKLSEYFSKGIVTTCPDHFVKYNTASAALMNMPSSMTTM